MYRTGLRLLHPVQRNPHIFSIFHARLIRLNYLFNTLLLPARNQFRMNRLLPSL